MAQMNANPNPSTRQAYSIEETAQQLSVGRNTIYNLLNNGELKSLRIGARRVIPANEITRLLNESRVSEGPQKEG
jgi:excisionase family DNA binding protein